MPAGIFQSQPVRNCKSRYEKTAPSRAINSSRPQKFRHSAISCSNASLTRIVNNALTGYTLHLPSCDKKVGLDACQSAKSLWGGFPQPQGFLSALGTNSPRRSHAIFPNEVQISTIRKSGCPQGPSIFNILPEAVKWMSHDP